MRAVTLLFLAGILVLQQFTRLPDIRWAWLLLFSVPVMFLRPWPRLPAAVLSGFLWALLFAGTRLAAELPLALEGVDLVAEGAIVSLPEAVERGVRFEFEIDSLRSAGKQVDSNPGHVRLSWYGDPPPLWAGERWHLTVRMKRPHGFMNPGGFDYEGWLFQHGIRATGYVRAAPDNARLDAGPGWQWLNRGRQLLREHLAEALADRPQRGVITALAIGERLDITSDQWRVLTATGTNHLVAISGLHVGLVAAFGFFLVRRLWPRFGNAALRWPAPKAAALAGLISALVYAGLAGFAIPTQRALIMIAVVMGGVMLPRHTAPSRSLALALLLVLVVDPLAVMAGGFWLSFGAVAVLLYGMTGRLAEDSVWWKWGRVQWLAAVGLLPVLLVLFQRASVVSPLANVVAVPWVSLTVVPLTLAGTFLLPLAPTPAGWLLTAAHALWQLLWLGLDWLASMDFALWTQHAPPAWTLLPGAVGALLLLAPTGTPARWLGLIWLAPLFAVRPPTPGPGEAWFTLLDVGQGLAAVVRTSGHLLVFDTGPRFSEHFDTGEAVVIPFTRHAGLDRVDMLLVSHGDMDHIGGAGAILDQLHVMRTVSSVPNKLARASAERCQAGMSWQWDDVRFEILHPQARDTLRKGNDRSCVLRVDTDGGSVLLTGDIEKGAEAQLLARQADKLQADILVVPHHGSRTSSTRAFIAAVRPTFALFPVGYRNRFGFPKAAVVKRYSEANVRMYDSAKNGAITFRLGDIAPVTAPETLRQTAGRFWNEH